jgi:methylaspartate ammonia-lyase
VRTRHLQLVTHEHSVTIKTRSGALSPYGPVRAGLTTSQITNEARLTELLNSLESVVASLVSKSCTVLDTLTTATKEMLAEPLPSTIDEAGIDARI